MGILIFHKIVLLLFQTKVKYLSNSNIPIELLLSLLCTILSIIVSLIITNIIRKILPILIGEKKEA